MGLTSDTGRRFGLRKYVMAATWTAKKGSAQFSRSGMVNSTRVVSVLHTQRAQSSPVRGHLHCPTLAAMSHEGHQTLVTGSQ